MANRRTYLPPKDFESRSLKTCTLPAKTWIRVHRKPPVYFGKNSNNRFTPVDSPFGVLYAGEEINTALYEVFGDEMLEKDCRIRLGKWRSNKVSALAVPEVTVCDLSDEQVRTAIRVEKATLLSTDFEITQAWALAIMTHPAAVDGIQYESRFHGKCLALFDRRELMIPTHLLGELIDLREAEAFLDKYQVALV
jgi:hypothetical protein